jgi:hypothetical protein
MAGLEGRPRPRGMGQNVTSCVARAEDTELCVRPAIVPLNFQLLSINLSSDRNGALESCSLWLAGEAMVQLCREFGISRKTGYKIFDRYQESGREALTDRSRPPWRYGNQLPQQVESAILTSKREKPHWRRTCFDPTSWRAVLERRHELTTY